MRRTLYVLICVLSLLLSAGAVAAVVHTNRAWHALTWRTDAAAAAEGAHTSLGAVWREYRSVGRVPGVRAGQRPKSRATGGSSASAAALADVVLLAAPPPAVTREYVSLTLASGRVEYRRYAEPDPPPV